MKDKKILLLLLFIFAVFSSAYILDETQQAVITQFGKPVKVEKEAGLHLFVNAGSIKIFYPYKPQQIYTGSAFTITTTGTQAVLEAQSAHIDSLEFRYNY